MEYTDSVSESESKSLISAGREPGKEKNTDNTSKELLKLNPSLSCKPLTSQLATLLYPDMLRKRLATLSNADKNQIKSATKCLKYSTTKNEKIKKNSVEL